MAILNAVIVPAKVLKGGRHKVRISVAHNGETRYIVTDIIIDSAKEFKNGTIVKRPDAAILNTKLRGILQRYQSTIDELAYVNGLSCVELVFQMKNAGNYKHRTIHSIYEEYIKNCRCKESTIRSYNTMWSTLSKHIPESQLAENFNHACVLSLDKFLRERGLKPTSLRNYMVFIMSLMNYAKRCGYVQFRVDPFFGYQLPEMEVRDSWLSIDEVKKIRDFKTTSKAFIKLRDMFMLSYYLGGINMIDMLNIDFKEMGDTLKYVRKKTENRPKMNKFVEFQIPKEAKNILDKWVGDDGYLALTPSQKDDKMHWFFDFNMPRFAKAVGINNLVFYSARKSFSQHAFKLGIETSVIDYILGHRVDKVSTSLYSYISVTPDMATTAVRKVLDNLK